MLLGTGLVIAVVFGERLGAYLMTAYVSMQVALHLTIGVWSYRDVMRVVNDPGASGGAVPVILVSVPRAGA